MPLSIQRTEPLPQKMTDIAEEWWNTVFDGQMWRVDGRVIPAPWRDNPAGTRSDWLATTFESCRLMRNAASHRARQRQLRCSAMIRSDRLPNPDTKILEPVWCIYLQTFENSVRIKDQRWDRAAALPAPAMPVALGPRGRGRGGPRTTLSLVDHTETIARLLQAQHGPAASPASLASHASLGWYVRQCTCGTLNFRTHEVNCPTYPLLGMMELVVQRQKLSPEDWAQQHGRRIW